MATDRDLMRAELARVTAERDELRQAIMEMVAESDRTVAVVTEAFHSLLAEKEQLTQQLERAKQLVNLTVQ